MVATGVQNTPTKARSRSGGRKLIIQIPCFNEEDTLPVTLSELPREVSGYDAVEWLIIDDGSTDRTVEVARENGVDHVISFRHNEGLAKAFMAGINASLRLGAHTIVNTDADNQYKASFIPALVAPIASGEADFVIGCRPIKDIEHFSPIKKLLQRIGSSVVKMASGADVDDAPSGFRAIHWETALSLNVFSKYTYTLETLIQAGRKNVRIKTVPVEVNGDLRPSRLVRSIPSYVWRSIITILRIFLIYKPFRTFALIGLLLGLMFMIVGGRFLYYYAIGEGGGHIQSLILAAILAGGSFISLSLAVVSDLVAVNRTLLEELRSRTLHAELSDQIAIGNGSAVVAPTEDAAQDGAAKNSHIEGRRR
jgi:glycosyltransferase involved in cell wall biosynthesis